jgi:hypothetical protein
MKKAEYVICKKALVQLISCDQTSEPRHSLWFTSTTGDKADFRVSIETAELVALAKIFISAVGHAEAVDAGAQHGPQQKLSREETIAKIMRSTK